jgi:uncharacterized membrane-anchored protein
MMGSDFGRDLANGIIALVVAAFVAGGAVFGLLYWIFSHLRISLGWQ